MYIIIDGIQLLVFGRINALRSQEKLVETQDRQNRDTCIQSERPLRKVVEKVKVIDYKMIGLKVLEDLVQQRSSNFSIELSSGNVTFLKNKGDNTEDFNNKSMQRKILYQK